MNRFYKTREIPLIMGRQQFPFLTGGIYYTRLIIVPLQTITLTQKNPSGGGGDISDPSSLVQASLCITCVLAKIKKQKIIYNSRILVLNPHEPLVNWAKIQF